MNFYIPHYSEKTSFKLGSLVENPKDISARQQLLKENGLICIAEKWVKDKGFVPVWESHKKFTQDEMNVLCICDYNFLKGTDLNLTID